MLFLKKLSTQTATPKKAMIFKTFIDHLNNSKTDGISEKHQFLMKANFSKNLL